MHEAATVAGTMTLLERVDILSTKRPQSMWSQSVLCDDKRLPPASGNARDGLRNNNA